MKFIARDDMDDIIRMLEDPRVTEYLYFAPAPPEVFHSYFGPIIEDAEVALKEERWPTSITYVIRDDENNFMGMIALPQVPMHPGNFEIGYQLPAQAWRKGISSTAAKLLTELAFNTLNAHKITADCYARNIGSCRVLEKAGLVNEGRQVGYYNIDGKKDDRMIYGITK
eukprot:CAMPEP_0117068758 /NCGR_PEP_ID=MMETSP0472-20121206/48194_1 /TAXON_ID=693140 ORGANISM="Tiarina fusus, Strain LIS" /NCGR_SAMPLE_ID=MMETSP0472 /ASSEMBLY_ACC=CAM_ASM_000603 /LENGTH=168 /DNA_ID=CAMNT_0004790959 /DNA_START=48 /DNA_END=551 /DNA_ORIENTATION=+